MSRRSVRIYDGSDEGTGEVAHVTDGKVEVLSTQAPGDVADVVITGPLESNGAIPVNIQDQHSRSLDLHFIQAKGAPTTNSVAVSAGDTTITLTSTTNFTAGTYVGLFTPTGQFYFGTQIGGPSGNIISLDTPVDKDYPIGSTVLPATRELAVDGSVTTQVFQVGPVGAGSGVEVDVTRIMGSILDGTSMDDGLFGGIAALTYGVVLRVHNGTMENLWNVKTNGDIRLICFDATYASKAPAGSYGLNFRNTYGGQSKHGVTIRLEPGDTLEVLIQDDLTDLESFTMMAQGHLVTD